MPVYEYRCHHCEHAFEELRLSTADADEVNCPRCGSGEAQRMISAFSARQGSVDLLQRGGGCGRCGDPAGPCGGFSE